MGNKKIYQGDMIIKRSGIMPERFLCHVLMQVFEFFFGKMIDFSTKLARGLDGFVFDNHRFEFIVS